MELAVSMNLFEQMFRSYEWLLVKQSWKGLGFVGLTRALRAHSACFVSGLIGL